MTYDELVAALQAAIDDPPVDGSAGEGDEQTADVLLERLVRAKGRADGAANAITGTPENPGATERAAALHTEYLAEVASWNARRTQYFEELDRSTRAVETILQERVTPGADSEVDAMDPGVAGDVGDIPAALARGRQAGGSREAAQAPSVRPRRAEPIDLLRCAHRRRAGRDSRGAAGPRARPGSKAQRRHRVFGRVQRRDAVRRVPGDHAVKGHQHGA